MVVPTVDTCRYSDVLLRLLGAERSLLLHGTSGVGKTVLIESVLGLKHASDPIHRDGHGVARAADVHGVRVTCSRAMTTGTIQGVLQHGENFHQVRGGHFKPAAGRRRTVLWLDDLNLVRYIVMAYHSHGLP